MKLYLVVWLFGFYVISTFVGYLVANPYLYKLSVLFQTIQISTNTQFNCPQKIIFQAIQFIQTVLIQPIQFSISIDFVYKQLNVKTVLYETI